MRKFAILLILIAASIEASSIIVDSAGNIAGAANKGSAGASAGPVVQEQVNTGNPALDKEIDKFYTCISKTHQDPPTLQIVDNCYYQTSAGRLIGSSGNTFLINHNNDAPGTRPGSGNVSPPPGLLVEVP